MRISGSDLRALRVFDALARHGGFSAAQSELNISQPTISNHLTALELRLGVKLCQRGRQGFRLTEKGEMVYAATQRLLQSHDDFSTEVGALRGRLAGKLKIGLVDCVATDPNSRLQEVMDLFQAKPNDVTLQLHQEFPQVLQRMVLESELHLAIGSFPIKAQGLSYTPLYEETHGLFCGRGHRLFAVPDDEIEIGSLKDEPVVIRGYWRNEYRRNLGFNRVAAIVYQIEPQLIAILSGRYIGFLPLHYAAKWVDDGQLRRLRADEIQYSCVFDLIRRRGQRPTQVVDSFVRNLRTVYGL
ncbi:MAG: LysR family transcriptional regulator [Albidovulum sp.]|nr:LysR family transcriptional regulator [Albidovulum sp.]MDE0530225.1 LysR family transcriptional regulator [Albidovulum sp.]